MMDDACADDVYADDAYADSACGGQEAGGACVRAVGCVCASSLGRRAGSGAASSVAANGCVGASSLVRAGRQRGQRVYPRRSLVRLGWVG